MASSIPYAENLYQDNLQYHPDFSFLSNNMQKKEQQYAQGLSEVSSGFSSILNAPVTSYDNRAVKEQYIKTAQDGLKKLSSTDLSLPSNVAQAESLYSPFWQDNELLQDIAYTKSAQNELGKLSGWQSSKDKDVRSQYNQDAVDYIQQGLNKLANAKRGTGEIGRVQRRQAVPFYDINADVDAAYKAEKGSGEGGIDTVNTIGNSIVTQHNGPQSKEAFKTWYLSKVGSKYDPQLYVIESVRVQRAKDQILRQNPGIDEKALNEHFATEQMGQLDNMYQRNISAYMNVANDWSKKYDDLYTQIQSQPGRRANKQQLDALQEYTSKIKEHQGIASSYQDEYAKLGYGDPSHPLYQKSLQDIAEHPEDYMAGIQKEIMADNWAKGMSVMNTHTKVEVDPRWQAYMTENDKALERQLTQRGIDATTRGQTLNWMKETGKDLQGHPIPGFDPNRASGWYGKIDNTGTGTGLTGAQSGSITGYDQIDVAHLPTGLDQIEAVQAQNMARVTNQVYSPNGIAAALQADGVDGSTVIDFTEGAKAMQAGGHLTESQRTAWNTVKKVLSDNGIPTSDILGPNQMQGALLKYSAIAAGKLLNSGNTAKIEQGRALINTYMNVSSDRDEVLANHREYNNALYAKVFSDPIYNPIRTPDGRIATETDIKKDIPPIQVRTTREHYSDPTPHNDVISPEQFAVEFAKGNVEIGKGQSLEGVQHILTINNKKYIIDPTQAADIDRFVGQHGTSTDFANLKRKAAAEVIPTLQARRNGIIVQNISWDPDVEGQHDFAVGLSKELANPSVTNTAGAYQQKSDINDSRPGNIAPKVINAVRNIIGSAEEMKAYTSGPKRTVTADGTPAYEYTFKSNTSTSKEIGTEGISLKDLAGNTYVLPVNAGANTPYLRSIPESTGSFVHSELLYNNTPVVSDPVIQASGFKSIIHPYSPVNGKNSQCYIEIQKSIPDPMKPGETKWVSVDKVHVNMLTGPDAKSPDEIVAKSNQLLSAHLDHIVSAAKVNSRNIPADAPALK